jgi:hypothetical protein
MRSRQRREGQCRTGGAAEMAPSSWSSTSHCVRLALMSSLLLRPSSRQDRRIAAISQLFGLKLIARSPIVRRCHTLPLNYSVLFIIDAQKKSEAQSRSFNFHTSSSFQGCRLFILAQLSSDELFPRWGVWLNHCSPAAGDSLLAGLERPSLAIAVCSCRWGSSRNCGVAPCRRDQPPPLWLLLGVANRWRGAPLGALEFECVGCSWSFIQ